MQETPNLKLKKPDLTDYVNVSDLNENADAIDAAVTLNKDNLTTHKAEDVKHGIFTMGGKRYQGQWLPTIDLSGLKFVYNEVIE